MRKNKTAKMVIVVVILLLTVAFALISTTLTINGTASVKSDSAEFAQNIKFSTAERTKPYLMVNGSKITENEPTVSADGKSITFEAPAFTSTGDNAELYYWIVNGSANYNAKIGELTCTATKTTGDSAEEYISVTPANAFNNTILVKGATTDSSDSVKVEMTRSYAGENALTYQVTCTITATGEEQ